MTHVLSWRNAAKVAWREARVSKGKFLFVVLAVAAGVGALTGVRGFSGSFRDTLLRDARTLLAADLSVRMFNLPSEAQQAVFDALERKGAERTWVTETLSMMSSPEARRPLLVGVKAVEPEKYPFYGAIELNPAGRLDAVLAEAEAMAVSDDLLVRLNVDVGDRVRLGDAGVPHCRNRCPRARSDDGDDERRSPPDDKPPRPRAGRLDPAGQPRLPALPVPASSRWDDDPRSATRARD